MSPLDLIFGKNTNPAKDEGLQGLEVSLDSSETTPLLYKIKSNLTNSITVESEISLTPYIGKTLIGVHTFQSLRVTRGAYLDFGTDRVEILNPTQSIIDATSQVNSGGITSGIPTAMIDVNYSKPVDVPFFPQEKQIEMKTVIYF